MISVRRTFTAALVCGAFTACKSHSQSATDSAAGSAASATATTTPDSATAANNTADSSHASSPSSFSDANILAKADAGDSAEVTLAKYVRTNSTNAAVKSYAELLETDHGKGMGKVEAVAKKDSITMQPPAGDTTAQETSHVLDHLKSLKGADLDTAFVNHEVADHQQDIADAKQMESAAKSPDVKSLITKELPELQKHLDRGEALQKKLSGTKS